MAAPASVAPAGGWVAPGAPRRSQKGVGTVLAIAGLGVLVLVALAVIGLQVGLAALPLATVLAFVPLGLVLAAIRWVDRWEPEPWQALAVAFGWGASVSVLVALVLNSGAMIVLAATGSAATADIVASTVVAPVVEESIKGLGVLVIFLVWRRSFDGPVDGLVYAATVAGGFAFVENILYFGSTMTQTAGMQGAGSALATIFMMRGVASPFAHVLFTACTGLALGVAAERRARLAWLAAFPVGLLLAMVLHGLWNGSAMIGDGSQFVVLYVLFQLPLFLMVVVLAAWLRRRESRVLRARLGELVPTWWFAPAEVEMVASLRERRRAQAWAGQRGGGDARRAMRDFQAVATRLAYLRNRARLQRADARAWQDETTALHDLVAARQRLQRSLAV